MWMLMLDCWILDLDIGFGFGFGFGFGYRCAMNYLMNRCDVMG